MKGGERPVCGSRGATSLIFPRDFPRDLKTVPLSAFAFAFDKHRTTAWISFFGVLVLD